MTQKRFRDMLAKADAVDYAEGLLAYQRYNAVMQALAHKYGQPLTTVTAAFVAMSPNNDYVGNLRSLVTVLDFIQRGKNPADSVISTYNHCKERAIQYLTGEVEFLQRVKGPKIRAFYQNILDPMDPRPVTIDGHMSAIWQGKNLTMKEALIKPREYEVIARDIRRVAKKEGVLPNQMQAILWFTRKRVFRIKYDPQNDLFRAPDDQWRTLYEIDQLRPYEYREPQVRPEMMTENQYLMFEST